MQKTLIKTRRLAVISSFTPDRFRFLLPPPTKCLIRKGKWEEGRIQRAANLQAGAGDLPGLQLTEVSSCGENG